MTRCAQCGRPLSDPVSVARGYGPVCWKKIQQQEKGKICKKCGIRFCSPDQSEYCPFCTATIEGKDILECVSMDDMGGYIDLSLVSCNIYEPENPEEEDVSCLTCALRDACRG